MSKTSDSDPMPTPGGAEDSAKSLPVRSPAPSSSSSPSKPNKPPGPQSSPRPRRRFKDPLPTPQPVQGTRAMDREGTVVASPEDPLTAGTLVSRPPRLTRERFNALLLASRQVDLQSLERIGQYEGSDSIDDVTLVDQVSRHRHPLSSVMISMTVHLVLFVLLALIVIPWPQPNPTIAVVAAISTDPVEKQLLDDPEDQSIQIELPEETQSPTENDMTDLSVDREIKISDFNSPIPSPIKETASPDPPVPVVPVVAMPIKPTGGGLEGRDQESRARLAAERGGSAASEAAVEKALAWIVEHQHEDGSWRLRHNVDQCRGQCPDEGTMESTTAATGLALMSLLGAGYTHRQGPYQEQVGRGLKHLIESMRMSSRGGSLARGDRAMYSHAIATIALSEALAMTGDTELVNPVASAREYIETAQHRKGGWRYNPGNAGDMTVTGWQLMALKSCQLSGYATQEEVWLNAETFIDNLRTSSGYYGYLKPSEHPTTTAVAALMKMYLGAGRDSGDVETAANYVAGIGPSKTDIYFNYYGTMVLFHRGGKDWQRWNDEMRELLIATQDDSGTHRNGSWFFRDQHGVVGGRLYTTAMAVMTLEVYYRYMPLYDEPAIADAPTEETP